MYVELSDFLWTCCLVTVETMKNVKIYHYTLHPFDEYGFHKYWKTTVGGC